MTPYDTGETKENSNKTEESFGQTKELKPSRQDAEKARLVLAGKWDYDSHWEGLSERERGFMWLAFFTVQTWLLQTFYLVGACMCSANSLGYIVTGVPPWLPTALRTWREGLRLLGPPLATTCARGEEQGEW